MSIRASSVFQAARVDLRTASKSAAPISASRFRRALCVPTAEIPTFTTIGSPAFVRQRAPSCKLLPAASRRLRKR